MTLDVYQMLAARTMNPQLTVKEQEDHALHGLSGEVGEIHSIYQKAYQGHAFDEEELKKEVGDLLWFIAELATCRGWKLNQVAMGNIEKLKRRYPEGFSEERSVYREAD